MAIAARGLTKRFGKVVALDQIELDVPSGSVFGLLGPAGSGKSTIVRLLAGLTRPSRGTLTIEGARAGSVTARRHLGVLLQDANLYGWMTAREALAFAADLAGVHAASLAARIDHLAGRLSLADVLHRRVVTLPGPARGRLAVAQAVIGDPAVLVLDEPFRLLDPEDRRDTVAALGALRERHTTVLAAQRLADLRDLCDRVALLDGGRVLFHGTTADLAGHMAPVYVVETAGAPGLALAGVVARLRAEPWVRAVVASGATLRIAVSDPDRAARELLQAVVGSGMSVEGVRREEGSLDELVARLRRP
jgi:ABC-2 type transport system ATP-binding protein